MQYVYESLVKVRIQGVCLPCLSNAQAKYNVMHSKCAITPIACTKKVHASGYRSCDRFQLCQIPWKHVQAVRMAECCS